MKFRLAIVPALALASALGAGAAQARDADVQWSVTIGSPVYGHRAPVVTLPAYPVYHAPAPVYHVPAPVYRAPVPVYHGYPIRYQAPTHWDRDGDGIPNRRDRLYNPAWDRDGDGIPNRHDRQYGHNNNHPRADNDRDGVPNRWDRYDNNPWRR
jgi:hypothetical protein